MTHFHRALAGEALSVPPIWLMRQAGRYQRSYQALRKRHSFEALCREPELAAAVTLAPVKEFDFDAAILFSDLLFPLEALGFGLSYESGGPSLDAELTANLLGRFRPIEDALPRLAFQKAAMRAARAVLPADRALLGFVGGPWTLFVYAMEGTHAGPLARAKASPALYRDFADRLVPLLRENIRLQFEGGADVVMVLDTAAGELSPAMFRSQIVPDLTALASAFPSRLGYYAKSSHPAQMSSLANGPWAGLGVDARWDLASVLADRPVRGFVQGNFDPALMLLGRCDLDAALTTFLQPLRQLDPQARRGWICGLGHGVLPGTPEDHVRRFVGAVREAFK